MTKGRLRSPLTPALSLGERGKRSQLFGEMMAESCLNAGGFYADTQRLFLLPAGDYCWLGSSNRNPAEPEAARPSERERTSPRQDEGERDDIPDPGDQQKGI